MAIIYSYPLTTPKVKDLLIGTSVFDEDDENSPRNNPTVSFTIQSLVDMIAPSVGGQTLQQVTNLGATTTNAITIAGGLSVNGPFTDSSGGVGIAGQVLSSTNIGTSWVTDNAGLNYYVTGATFDTATGILAITGNNALVGASIDLDGRYLTANQTITLSGDVTGTGTTAIATTLATVNANVGAFTNANITVNAKGLVTAASDGSSGGVSSIVAGTNITLSPVTGLGDVTINSTYSYTLPVATSVALGGVKIGYTEAGKNYPVELNSDQMYVNVPWTDTAYTLPLAASGTRGGVQIGYTEAGKNYPVELDTEKMFVNVPWTDTAYTLPVAADGTLGGVQLGYVVNAKNYPIQLDNEKMFVNVPWTDANTWVANSVNVAGYVAAPGAVASKVWKTDASGNPAWRDDADTDTGVTGVTLAIIDSVGAPLLESIATRELTLTSTKYVGGSNVGYVPEGGTSTTYLKGDGTWAAVPTGLVFKGTWDASATGGGNPDLTVAANQGDGFLWITNVAGSATPNGAATTPNSWAVGDWAVYSGAAGSGTWTKVPATNTGVTSLITTDGTYIDLTPTTATTGAVTVTADLNAQDGSSDTMQQSF